MKKYIILAVITALVFVGFAAFYHVNVVSEGDYIQKVDNNTFKPDTQVSVTVKKVANTHTMFGWCIYGTEGGLWLSDDNPHVKKGQEIIVIPNEGKYVLGSWTFTYDMAKRK